MKLQRHTIFMHDFGNKGIFVLRDREDNAGKWVPSDKVTILEEMYAQLEKVNMALELANHALTSPELALQISID